jgi:hypothetical protein
MRAVTATEKYNAVLEGKMAKKEFVRQMRQQYPMYISQFSGFDDTVQILKNRRMVYENAKPAFSEAKVYDDRPALTYSLDALERGIRIELEAKGITTYGGSVKIEDFYAAEKKAKDNLEKDANHYLNLMSGESNKVDKHDKEKEVKRGSKDKDVFNGMKKATLKEESLKEDEEEDARNDADYEAGWADDPRKDEGMSEDAKKNLLGKVVGALRTNYPDITAGVVKDFIKTHYQDLLDGADIEGEFEEYIYANYETASDFRDVDEKYDREDGDGHIGTNTDDDFEREMQQQLAQREGKGKDHDGDGDIDGDDYMAAKDKAIKKAMGKGVDEIGMFHDPRGYDSNAAAEDKRALELIKAMINKGVDRDTAIEKAGEKFGLRTTYLQKKMSSDSQIKEAIKTLIKRTLTEETLNEAATGKLSQKMEELGSYNGAQGVINSLENIVTEVESFYGKVRDKIQKIYDDMGNIENEEGLKIGQFIGPAIESAFMQDLRPVTKKGFTQDLQLPKPKKIDPEMLAQARAAGEVDESPEDPKATIFTPNF